MAITVKTDWTLLVSTIELRLILKALGGRLKPEDIEEANELGDRLTLARAQATKNAILEVDKLMENLTK